MATQSKAILGVDLGGTKIEAALVDENGNILSSHRCPTDESKNPDKVIADTVACIQACLSQTRRKAMALGVGVAGQIDSHAGLVRSSPNLTGWHDVPLRARLEEALKIPVVINNDVRAVTLGEWRYGAGRGVNDLVCLFVGTGVGGGVVSGGRLLEGCSNTAGELGHLPIVTGGRQCHCPNQGCLEAYAGGWAIAERAQEAVCADPTAGKILIKLAGGSIEQVSAMTVSQAYICGDPLGRHLLLETVFYLASGVVGIINAFNPCLLVLGGGVIEGMPQYLSLLVQMVRDKALHVASKDLRICNAELGNKAGVIGASVLARDYVKS